VVELIADCDNVDEEGFTAHFTTSCEIKKDTSDNSQVKATGNKRMMWGGVLETRKTPPQDSKIKKKKTEKIKPRELKEWLWTEKWRREENKHPEPPSRAAANFSKKAEKIY
jgi:hypothetical protein